MPPAPQKSSKLPIAAAVLGGILMLTVLAMAVKILVLDSQDTSSKETVSAENDTVAVTNASGEEDDQEDRGQKSAEPKKASTPTPVPSPTPTPIQVPVVNKIDMGHVQNLLGGRGSGASSSLYIYDLNQETGRGTDNSEEARPASALITIPILYTAAKQIDNGALSLDTPVPFE